MAGSTPNHDVPTAPTEFHIDFSSTLQAGDYSGKVQLLATANPSGGPDGDFGTDPFFRSVSGFSQVPVTVTLTNSVAGAEFGDYGYMNRLVVKGVGSAPLALGPDHYRLFLPNTGTTQIKDVFDNVIDGGFLGDKVADNSGIYEDFLSNGQYDKGPRTSATGAFAGHISGDGVEGAPS